MTFRGLLDDIATQAEHLHQQLQDAANLAADEGYAPLMVSDVGDLADAMDDVACRIDQTCEQLRSTTA